MSNNTLATTELTTAANVTAVNTTSASTTAANTTTIVTTEPYNSTSATTSDTPTVSSTTQSQAAVAPTSPANGNYFIVFYEHLKGRMWTRQHCFQLILICDPQSTGNESQRKHTVILSFNKAVIFIYIFLIQAYFISQVYMRKIKHAHHFHEPGQNNTI